MRERGTEIKGVSERERDRKLLDRYNRTMYTKYVINERLSEELRKVTLNHKLGGMARINE